MFGELVKSYRQQANLTISDLAEQTGLNRSVLTRLESGETKRPLFSTYKSVANALSIPYEQVLLHYLHQSERAETLKMLLSEAVATADRHIVRKAAVKLLESPKINTFLALDHLLQLAREADDPQIRLTLYHVTIEYAKKRGIPYYLAKSLLERYLIERYDFSRLEETYRRGRELLDYMEYLQVSERVVACYRLGLHAYALKYYDESIELCRMGIAEDAEDGELKASALMSITNAYIALGDWIMASVYLKEYQNSRYADPRRARYHQALLYAQKDETGKAVSELKACLAEAERDTRIAIAADLLEICLDVQDYRTVDELIEAEARFFPETLNTPKGIEITASYCRNKGKYLLAKGREEDGLESLVQSMTYYQRIGAYEEVNSCIGMVLGYCHEKEKPLSKELLEKLERICNNRR